MRILHTSDWHLGQELYGADRGREHDMFLSWLLLQLEETATDVLLVTGDIYDVANPSVESQQRLYRFLRDALFLSKHLQIVIIGGNHDSPSRLELPRDLLDCSRVTLVGAMPRQEGQIHPAGTVIELRDAIGSPAALCIAIPYLRPGDLPLVGEGESAVASIYGAAMRAVAGSELPIIITGHLHTSGAEISELSERRIVIGGQEAVSADIFPAEAAYVALGHLHKPQLVAGHTIIRYAGSPFPMSVAEKDYKHSVTLLDLSAEQTEVRLLPTPRPARFLRVPDMGALSLDTLVAELIALEATEGDNQFPAYVEVAVRLDEVEPELRRRVEDALGDKPFRLTRIVRQGAGDGVGLADAIGQGSELSNLDPLQVFGQLYRSKHATEVPEELRKAFTEIVAAANDAGELEVGQ